MGHTTLDSESVLNRKGFWWVAKDNNHHYIVLGTSRTSLSKLIVKYPKRGIWIFVICCFWKQP